MLMVPVLLGVTVVVFGLTRLVPGDPVLVMLGVDATPEEAVRLRALLGLDQPLPIQYFRWLNRVLSGDLGRTLFGGQEVVDLLTAALPATLELTITALIVSLAVALPIGVVSPVRRGSPLDYGGMMLALVGISTPVFWLGIMLMLVFALTLGWLPFNGRGVPLTTAVVAVATGEGLGPLVDSLKHLALPALALGVTLMGPIARLTRSSMLEVLQHDYVRVAWAKGLRERHVVVRHALKNAMLPVITVLGLQFGALLGGAIVTETVFGWPGVGRLLVNAILQHDYPVVQGGVLLLALLFSLVNLLVDLSYGYLNPKIRFGQ